MVTEVRRMATWRGRDMREVLHECRRQSSGKVEMVCVLVWAGCSIFIKLASKRQRHMTYPR